VRSRRRFIGDPALREREEAEAEADEVVGNVTDIRNNRAIESELSRAGKVSAIHVSHSSRGSTIASSEDGVVKSLSPSYLNRFRDQLLPDGIHNPG
jgi:hypothetical protein